jgi:Subtilase family
MEKYTYFQPGQFVFVISHEQDNPLNDAPIDALINWCNNKHATNLKLEILRRPEREIHFPGTLSLEPATHETAIPDEIDYQSPEYSTEDTKGAFSLIPVDVIGPINPDTNPEGYVDPSELAKLIVQLDDDREADDQPLRDLNIALEAVSPNWLSAPGSEFGGGGGPGGRPVPYRDTTSFPPYRFTLPPEIEELAPETNEGKRGLGVRVAILDTAPCLHELAEAYELYHKIDPEKQAIQRQERGTHPLLESLLRPNGPLYVHPASYEELLRMRAVHLRDHNYKMTNHGLFVAGIVHSIAPSAEIHLHEVLNPDGVGDLESIARGLWEIADEQYKLWIKGEVKHLVVNCSFVLRIPLYGDPTSPDSQPPLPGHPQLVGHWLKDMDQVLLDKLINDPNWVERAGAVIGWICHLLYRCGSRIVAAAGNDRRPKKQNQQRPPRPVACYPAAHKSVLGIGALPKGKPTTPAGNLETSTYSNLADAPGAVGVATLGGEPQEEKGILGIYLGRFPSPNSGHTNNTNWAWWAGTSFATPIVSGIIASVLSGPTNPRTTEDAIRRMYGKGVIVNNRTDYEEDALEVTQE